MGVGSHIGPDAYEDRKIGCLGRQSNNDSFTCPLDCAKPCREKAGSLFLLITQPQLTVTAFFQYVTALFSMYAVVREQTQEVVYMQAIAIRHVRRNGLESGLIVIARGTMLGVLSVNLDDLFVVSFKTQL